MKRAISRRQVILSAPFAFSTIFALGSWARVAEAYPNRPIHLLVGGAAGSVPDTLARIIADRLSSSLGEPVVTEDRPGAAGVIAINALLAAARKWRHHCVDDARVVSATFAAGTLARVSSIVA